MRKSTETKISPSSNKLFEGSRFIMPEHREAMLKHTRNQLRRNRPHLDEHELEIICHIISESYMSQVPIKIELFNEYRDEIITGTVVKIDQQLRRIKIASSDENRWIPKGDILRIR